MTENADLSATIAAIREAASTATPRPWRVTDEPPCETYGVEATIAAGADDFVVSTLWHEDMALAMRPDDRTLIVLAANHITELCDEVERLRAENAALRAATEPPTFFFNAGDKVRVDADRYHGPGVIQNGPQPWPDPYKPGAFAAYIDVLLPNGNTWSYPASTVILVEAANGNT